MGAVARKGTLRTIEVIVASAILAAIMFVVVFAGAAFLVAVYAPEGFYIGRKTYLAAYLGLIVVALPLANRYLEGGTRNKR